MIRISPGPSLANDGVTPARRDDPATPARRDDPTAVLPCAQG